MAGGMWVSITLMTTRHPDERARAHMKIIRAHLTLAEQDSDRRHHCILSWDPTHPWHTDLLMPGPDQIVWRFARGVWADGLTARTWGHGGDVMVEPLPDGDLHLWLRGWVGPDTVEIGAVDYLTSRALVARFVRDTHEVVPLGREPLPMSADELLAELLG